MALSSVTVVVPRAPMDLETEQQFVREGIASGRRSFAGVRGAARAEMSKKSLPPSVSTNASDRKRAKCYRKSLMTTVS